MLEAHVRAFFHALGEGRYGKSAVSRYRFVVREFLLFLDGHVARPEDLATEHVEQFFEARERIFRQIWGRPITGAYQVGLDRALRLFLRFLAGRGICTQIVLPDRKDPKAVPGYQELLTEYERFLINHRGVRPATVSYYTGQAGLLCLWMIEAGVSDWGNVTPSILYDHIRREAKRLGYKSLAGMQTALRSFFRFLHATGRCKGKLDRYLLSFRSYKLSRVPPRIAPEDLYRLFEDSKGDDPTDLKDRAVLLLLTLYGLRSGEVASLTMDDVRWKDQQLLVRRRKAGRPLMLPLHPAVARALYDYVARARPRGVPFRELFITRRAPSRPYPTGSGITDSIRDRLRRLGLKLYPHALRHGLATHLINNDCPPEWIQVLLGHVRFTSTQIYAKADMAHLAEVADLGGADL